MCRYRGAGVAQAYRGGPTRNRRDTSYQIPNALNQHWFESLLAQDNSGLKTSNRPTWRDPAAVLFTAGTTGPAKGNIVSHNYINSMAAMVCDIRNISAHDTLFSPLPMFHMQALVATLLAAQLAGVSAGLDWTFSVSQYWDRVRHYRATNGLMLGTMLTMLWNNPPTEHDSTQPMRVLMCAPIPPSIHRPFEDRFNLRLVTAYGNTECGLPVTSTWDDPPPPDTPANKAPGPKSAWSTTTTTKYPTARSANVPFAHASHTWCPRAT